MQRAGDQKAKALESVLTPTQLDKYHQQRAIRAKLVKDADSDQFGHLFQKYSDSVPGYSDSCRSVATLWLES